MHVGGTLMKLNIKYMSFLMKENNLVRVKYDEIWHKVSGTIKKAFEGSMDTMENI